jgi:phosphonate transport system substrate-binding protein
VEASVKIYDDPATFEAAIKAGGLDLIIPDTWTLLAMDVQACLEPRLVASERGLATKRYLLLARRDRGWNSLADLRGKTLLALAAPNANLGSYWLDYALRTDHLGSVETFFSRTERFAKPSAVVLPVFFGKTDACLVDSTGFALMSELNPQVGTNLLVLASSQPLLNTVICLSRAGWSSDRFRRDLAEALAELHLEPAGQQVLTLFKTERLIPFDEKQLETVRELRAACGRLRQEPLGEPASAPPPLTRNER